MVLAEGKHVNILHDDHLVVVFLEQRIGQHLLRILRVAACQHLHCFGHTHGSLL